MLLDIQQRGEVMNLRSTVRLGALHSGSYPTLTQPVGAKASLLQRAVLPWPSFPLSKVAYLPTIPMGARSHARDCPLQVGAHNKVRKLWLSRIIVSELLLQSLL